MTNSNPFATPDGEAEANNSNTTQNQGGANTVGANQAGVPNPATYSAQNSTDTANPAQTSAETATAQTSNGASYANPTYSAPTATNPASTGDGNMANPNSANPGTATAAAQSATPADPSAQYGANRFWGSPGYQDPMAGTNQNRTQSGFESPQFQNHLQTQANWSPEKTKVKRSGPGWAGAFGLALATSLVVSGGVYGMTELVPDKAETTQSTLFNPKDKNTTTSPTVSKSTSQNPNWQAVAQAVRPAVVAITAVSGSSAGQGSGVILDSEGHILTNNHVVAEAAGSDGKYMVELSDGRLYEATLVGRDVVTDVAVLKLNDPPKDLTVANLGNSDDLEVGQAVAAIGNPLGLSSSVTTGIVSALDRPVQVQAVQGASSEDNSGSDFEDLFRGLRRGGEGSQNSQQSGENDVVTTNAIQVDAAINPGNSGGPLFDAQGRVIGVNTLIYSNSSSEDQAGSIGLGFAIPINQAAMIAQQLIEHGQAVHAALGVRVTDQVAKVGDVSRLGAEVMDITSGGAASKSDLKEGDIIVSINGQQVKGSSSLVGWVRQHAVGDTVELGIVRDGKEMKLSVTLQAQ